MRNIRTILLFFLIAPSMLHAKLTTDSQILKDKLAKFSQISADFAQVVSSAEGKVLNKCAGNLSISRPGKFRWQVITPEEELIVSNGQTMWIYSAFIEQVTLMNLHDAIQGTPFVLLSGANEKQWQDYSVKQENNQFTVKNAHPKVQANTIIFEFNEAGNISKFVVIEEQGQHSEFTLTHKPLTANLAANLFEFQIPAGIEIDDQR